MIEIRTLHTLAEMYQAVDLQTSFWGQDSESVIPAHMLFSLATHGGHVLAAFDDERLIGVLIDFLGTSEPNSDRPAMANLQIVSKRMVVLPDYRNQGVGYQLKLAQRDIALKMGIRLITWTFNPLLAANAYLNIRKLGVTCQTYVRDYYGNEDRGGGLVVLGSSDRLIAEWWVTHRRVEERLFGSRSDLTLDKYLGAGTTIVNPTTLAADGTPIPASQPNPIAGSLALLEIPPNFYGLLEGNPTLAATWRDHVREMFIGVMSAGFIVTDFLHEAFENRPRAFYLLSYNGPQFDNFTMN